MKNSVNEDDILNIISSSTSPVTANTLANQLGVLRNAIFPILTKLMNSGQITTINTGNGSPSFTMAAGVAPPSPNTPAKREAAKLAVVPKKAQAKQEKPVSVAQKAAEPSLAVVSPKTTSPASPDSKLACSELTVLAALTQHPRSVEDLVKTFGNCEKLIDSMAENGLIERDYIIDQYVCIPTNQAAVTYPELKDLDQVEAILYGAKAEPAPAIAVAEMPEAPVAVVKSSIDVPEAQAPKEQTTSTRKLPAEAHVDRDPEFNQGDHAFSLPEVFTAQLATMVERLVNDRLDAERAARVGFDKAAVLHNIELATQSLKAAALALEATAALIKKS